MTYLAEDDLVDLIHTTPTRAVVISTGGGTEIFPMLLHRGGGSATLISGLIPYGIEESTALMGGTPDKLVSEQAARIMAMAAFQRALRYRPADGPVIGVATSSVLQKTPSEREGRVHYIYAALQTESKTVSLTLEMEPNHPLRHFDDTIVVRCDEEYTNSLILLNLIAEGCGLQERADLGIPPSHIRRTESTLSEHHVSGLLTGKWQSAIFDCHPFGLTGPVVRSNGGGGVAFPNLILPGSFNPFHVGHQEMAQVASRITGYSCDFELSMSNVDKPKLDLIGLEERLNSFNETETGFHRVLVTDAATFVDKARLFPGVTFAVGYDTAIRIVDPKYCPGGQDAVMSEFIRVGVKFLVFGRKHGGTFKWELDPTIFPEKFRSIATTVQETMFHRDISSSDIRQQRKATEK